MTKENYVLKLKCVRFLWFLHPEKGCKINLKGHKCDKVNLPSRWDKMLAVNISTTDSSKFVCGNSAFVTMTPLEILESK